MRVVWKSSKIEGNRVVCPFCGWVHEIVWDPQALEYRVTSDWCTHWAWVVVEDEADFRQVIEEKVEEEESDPVAVLKNWINRWWAEKVEEIRKEGKRDEGKNG